LTLDELGIAIDAKEDGKKMNAPDWLIGADNQGQRNFNMM
jgi:hypothetical protein